MTAKSCLGFFVFVVTPKTLEVEWAVKQGGTVEGGGHGPGQIPRKESFVSIKQTQMKMVCLLTRLKSRQIRVYCFRTRLDLLCDVRTLKC